MKNNGLWFFVLLAILLLNAGCQNSTQREDATISIDDTKPYSPEIKVRFNTRSITKAKTGWKKLSGLYIIENDKVSAYPVSCRYELLGDTLKFIPVSPLGRGVEFEIQVYLENDTLKKRFVTPAFEKGYQSPAIKNIYPITDKIPENILMFHVEFETPMVEDIKAYTKVFILDDEGNKKEKLWREKSNWTNNGEHLVLMLHPGRIKREIEYMEELGPLFERGKKYTLVVSLLIDKAGKPLEKEYRKEFTAIAADREVPVFDKKNFKTAQAKTKEPLQIAFTEPMDYGTSQIGIKVLGENKKEINGEITTFDDRVLMFTPNLEWESGEYTVEMNDYLTDLASNHLNRKFEVEHLDSITKQKPLLFKFSIP